MYLIVTTRQVHHAGDERSRQHPGHGYPAWTEDVQKVEEFEKYDDFLKQVAYYLERDQKVKLYNAEPMKATKRIEVDIV